MLSSAIVAAPVILAPLTVRVPETTVDAFAIVAVPVAAPRLSVVAAPPIFSVVTVAFSRLKVVAVEVRSPPLTAMSPASCTLPLVTLIAQFVLPPVGAATRKPVAVVVPEAATKLWICIPIASVVVAAPGVIVGLIHNPTSAVCTPLENSTNVGVSNIPSTRSPPALGVRVCSKDRP